MENNSKYRHEIELIVRFLNEEFSETEYNDFELWLNEKPENKMLFDETKNIWEHSGNLSSLLSVDIDKDWKRTKQRINFEAKHKTIPLRPQKTYYRYWRVAAAIIILVGIGWLSKQFLFMPPEMILVQTGNFTNEVVLPDGSQVVLNYYSSIQYPEKFKRNNRQVNLSGEGFFDVVKNPNKIFRINIDNQAFVDVLGTSFNINSISETKTIEVNVVSGTVAFYTPGYKNTKTIMVKNENASLDNGVISKNNLGNKNFQSWRTGIIYFEEEEIKNVCEILSTYYKKDIITEGLENSEIRFTSTIDNQELENVLEEIKLVLNLDYTVQERKIIIHEHE